MKKPISNWADSVRARLLNRTKQRGGDFNLTLHRYAAERFLYRLGISRYHEAFVLKGAMLFVLWGEDLVRPTRDLDLAGYWDNDPDSLRKAFAEICVLASPQDGAVFKLDTLEIEPIREATKYHGYRLTLDVGLGQAVIPFQVDVGFGDAIVPEAAEVAFPTLLDAEAPRIRAYARETVIAEKLHAMVHHGAQNSRYKDFLDVYSLSRRFEFDGRGLARAISATFARRESRTLDPWPVALTPPFYDDPFRAGQWVLFVKRSKVRSAPERFAQAGEAVIAFLAPLVEAVAAGVEFRRSWTVGGPWR